MLEFYSIVPLGLEELHIKELQEAGGQAIRAKKGGVAFKGSMETAMRACLTTRLASRILMKLATSDYYDEEDIYNFACRTKWENYFDADKTIRVDLNARRANLESLDFTLLRVKDGICDRFSHFFEKRPTVDRVAPQVRIFAFVDPRDCTFYLDLCGEALFKRGWRRDKGEAPLKENLAAGLLMLSGWTPEKPLLDPFCGSGTIAIEAASIATNTAPGLRRHFLFENLNGFDKELWLEIKDDAQSKVNHHVDLSIEASDISTHVIEKALENARLAGFTDLIINKKLRFAATDARKVVSDRTDGVIVANPPYGEQSNPKSASVASMMKDVADNFKKQFAGWQAWLLTSDLQLPRQMRLSESRKIPLFNGPLECRFFRFDLVAGSFRKK